MLCGNLAEIYVALCEAMELTARVVALTVAVQNGNFGVDTHAGAPSGGAFRVINVIVTEAPRFVP